MKEINIDKRGYRSKKRLREPIIMPGALRRLAIYGSLVVALVLIGIPVYQFFHWLVYALWPIS